MGLLRGILGVLTVAHIPQVTLKADPHFLQLKVTSNLPLCGVGWGGVGWGGEQSHETSISKVLILLTLLEANEWRKAHALG